MKPDLFTISGGNTNLTIGAHEGTQLIRVLSFDDFHSLIKEDPSTAEIPAIGSFTKKYFEIDQLGLKDFQTAPHLENNQFLDMQVDYTESIGNDRLIASYYCFKQYPLKLEANQKMALIDCGTFTTINLLQESVGYLGGYIFPGVELLKTSYSRGENLHEPDLKKINQYNEIPHSTDEAIQFAFNQLILSQLEILNTLNIQKVVITGGASEYFLHLLENPIHIPHLLHSALGQLHQIMRNRR